MKRNDKMLVQHRNGTLSIYNAELADRLARKSSGKHRVFMIAPDDVIDIDSTDDTDKEAENA